MIKRFVQRWNERKQLAADAFAAKHPGSYADVVRIAVTVLSNPDNPSSVWPDPERIQEIDHGDYQGTLIYVVGQSGYQPSTYWGVSVDYGSCSGCDTLECIRDFLDGPPTDNQIAQYMTLAFDVLRGMKQISGYVWDETTEDTV
jgi:hypothetical protein